METIVIEGDKDSKLKIIEELKINPDYNLVFETSSLNKGMKHLAKIYASIDVLILDIDLDYQPYFETIEEYSASGMNLILTLTDNRKGIELFKLEAKDFLQKTFSRECVAKVLNGLKNAEGQQGHAAYIQFENYSIHPNDIIYVEYMKPKTQATFLSGTTVEFDLSLNEWEEKLKDHSFYLINRNYLINLNHTERVGISYPWAIKMKNKKIFMTTQRKRADFHKAFKQFLKSQGDNVIKFLK
jgi:DNA-binding LytR/AlgR family response regulator